MPDAKRCCILGICCPPDSNDQRAALREQLSEQCGGSASSYNHLVEYLTSEYDLVPKGVGEALVNFYKAEFEAAEE